MNLTMRKNHCSRSLPCALLGAFALLWLCGCPMAGARTAGPPALPQQYENMQKHLAEGWNTWDTDDVLDEVLLPQAASVRVSLKHNSWTNGDDFLSGGDISRRGPDDPRIHVLHHSYDGSYTALDIVWDEHTTRIETAHAGRDLVILVTPLSSKDVSRLPLTAVFSLGFVWNSPGTAEVSGRTGKARCPAGELTYYLAGETAKLDSIPISNPYLAANLNQPAGLSSGHARSLAQIRARIDEAREKYEASLSSLGTSKELADALVSAVGWNTIYDPENRRVVVPSSRDWNMAWGGYALFEWDTFLVSPIAAMGSRDLAYADAIEMCREITHNDIVPNYARGGERKSDGRSEPPVGSLVVLDLYRRFGDRWLLEAAYPYLLRWNRWWARARDVKGYLVWGDDGKPDALANGASGTRQGAIYESGLDNSPMYDDAPYDPKSHRLLMADVGLLSLYIADCNALATIAETLGKTADAGELHKRSSDYSHVLASLWDDSAGIYKNKNLLTGQLSSRLSPTNFYPLLAGVPTPEQADRMVSQHLLNPDEFWGTWVIPSISRRDPAFADQNYWRGRIWGPMNYLVARGLRNYDSAEIRQARSALAQKSAALFLKEWKERGHVHENYNALTGNGDDVQNSDDFYTWGALLGLLGAEQ